MGVDLIDGIRGGGDKDIRRKEIPIQFSPMGGFGPGNLYENVDESLSH